jgi:hypothetical protein
MHVRTLQCGHLLYFLVTLYTAKNMTFVKLLGAKT